MTRAFAQTYGTTPASMRRLKGKKRPDGRQTFRDPFVPASKSGATQVLQNPFDSR